MLPVLCGRNKKKKGGPFWGSQVLKKGKALLRRYRYGKKGGRRKEGKERPRYRRPLYGRGFAYRVEGKKRGGNILFWQLILTTRKNDRSDRLSPDWGVVQALRKGERAQCWRIGPLNLILDRREGRGETISSFRSPQRKSFR